MKKLFVCLLFVLSIFTLGACSSKEKLYVINVGDYINQDLVKKFEKENNCKVVYKECNSNEQIYQTLKNDSYDIAVVSDYMIDKMSQEGLLEELDPSKFVNYKFEALFDDAKNLINENCSEYKNAFVPYYWGTVGILYRTDVEGLEDYVMDNGLKAMYSSNDYRKGMYDSARDALCMALLAKNTEADINTSNTELLNEALQSIKSVSYTMWGDDNLKRSVHENKIDMALVYSGDYLDLCWLVEDEGETVDFAYYAPESTNIWIDGMVMLENSKNKELAYKFLDFFAEFDNCVENALYIGYAPLFENVFNEMYTNYSDDMLLDREDFYPYAPTRKMYKHVSDSHYALLNDLLDQAKQN